MTLVMVAAMATDVVEAWTEATETERRGRGGGATSRARWTRGRTLPARGAAEMPGGVLFGVDKEMIKDGVLVGMLAVQIKGGMAVVLGEMNEVAEVLGMLDEIDAEMMGEKACEDGEALGRSAAGSAG